MVKSLFSAMAAMALGLLAPTAAHATATYNFDFSPTSSSGTAIVGYGGTKDSSGNYNAGNSVTFQIKGTPLLVKATAWSINTKGTSGYTDDIVNKAVLTLWDGGLGVHYVGEDSGSPEHSTDNSGRVDFIMLQFDRNVELNTVTTGWVQGDQDMSMRVAAGNAFTWDKSFAFDNNKVIGSAMNSTDELSDLFSMYDKSLDTSTTRTDPYTRDVNCGPTNPCGSSAGQKGMIWLIGALYGTNDSKSDYFKLDGLNMTVWPTVPEPSTWMTMILGFGFVGWGMRRRGAAGRKIGALA